MCKVKPLVFALSAVCFVSVSYAQQPQATSSWLNATATTRSDLQSLQAQISQAREQSAELNAKQQQSVEQTLQTLVQQQDAMLKNQNTDATTENDTPEFSPQPRKAKGSNNPWLKQYQYKKSQENPYAGQQYGPNETNATGDGIYVKPKQNSNQGPINIFK